MSLADEIKEWSKAHPKWDAGMLADHFGCRREYVRTAARRLKFSPNQDIELHSWTVNDIATLIRLREDEGMKWCDIAIVMNRPLSTCQKKYVALTEGVIRLGTVAERVEIPESCLEERDRRLNIPHRDITAAFMGDPLPGYSALERRT